MQFSGDLSHWQNNTVTPTILADDGTNQIVSVPYPAGLGADGFFPRAGESAVSDGNAKFPKDLPFRRSICMLPFSLVTCSAEFP